MIRFGTAGWQYRDWEGSVYPKPQPRGFDPLSYLAGFFDVVEIDFLILWAAAARRSARLG